jgi:hypothetical protein
MLHFLLPYHLPYHKTRIVANTNGRWETDEERTVIFILAVLDGGGVYRTPANERMAVVSSADFLKL